MACGAEVSKSQTFVPVCANVLLEAPGVIYVSIDPDVWKIRCRQCQEKTEHKCALKKLKNRFRGNPNARREPRPLVGRSIDEAEAALLRAKSLREEEDMKRLRPPTPIPDNVCICEDRPPQQPPKPNLCTCAIFKPLKFMLQVDISGEFKPVVKYKKEK